MPPLLTCPLSLAQCLQLLRTRVLPKNPSRRNPSPTTSCRHYPNDGRGGAVIGCEFEVKSCLPHTFFAMSSFLTRSYGSSGSGGFSAPRLSSLTYHGRKRERESAYAHAGARVWVRVYKKSRRRRGVTDLPRDMVICHRLCLARGADRVVSRRRYTICAEGFLEVNNSLGMWGDSGRQQATVGDTGSKLLRVSRASAHAQETLGDIGSRRKPGSILLD